MISHMLFYITSTSFETRLYSFSVRELRAPQVL